jgi:UDP-N-acetylmuramyl pentapeptide phosphotransferase/UDP-N-acetylglucosamine-1-phosphate transferase
MPFLSQAFLTLAAALLSWALVGLYMRAMLASRRLEPPNERSMHNAPVPVGAGLGIVATVLLLWPQWQFGADRATPYVLACFGGLAALSWLDDRRALSPAVRLGGQAVAVAVCLAALPADIRILDPVPLTVERLILGVGWLWFINLFNFMDGIDGLAGSEAIFVAGGYLAVLWLVGAASPYAGLALMLAAATLGYLIWNWHPARVLMGDAGSIPLGFALGWLMIDLAGRGYWAAAAILPLYFAADASMTLLARMRRGQVPWKPHREHFYQRAVLAGLKPSRIVARIGAANTVLVLLALFSTNRPGLALAAAGGVVVALIAHLHEVAARTRTARARPPEYAEPRS